MPFAIATSLYHPMAVADEQLYVVAADGRIFRSRDLLEWQTVPRPDGEVVAVRYWPYMDWLIIAGGGVDGRLWRLDLSPAGTPSRVPR